MNLHLRRPSSALVLALIALFASLGGAALAAKTAKKNSVVSKSIKTGAVKGVDIGDGTIQGVDVAPDTLGGAQIDESTLDGLAIPGNTKRKPFIALLGANETKTLTAGTFTFRETATNNALCDDLRISAGPKAATGNYKVGPFPIAANTTVILPSPADHALFAANDGSELAGLDFALSQVPGGKCLFWGYVSEG